jgi:hypothetical protein
MRDDLKMLSKLAVVVVLALLGGRALTGASSSSSATVCESPCVPGSEDIMSAKAHGTSETPVQSNLRWNVDWDTADRICNYNR